MLKSTHKAATPAASVTSLPEGWTKHTAPSGHKYYYNASTNQSTYTRPTVEQDAQLEIDFNATQPDLELRASLLAQDEFQKNNAVDPPGQSHSTGRGSYKDHARRRGHGGDRPKSKEPIPNCAPWLLVKTKFERRFVHNTETRQSFWKFPQDVMMAVIDMDRMEWEAKKKTEHQVELGQHGDRQEAEAKTSAEPHLRQEDYDSDSYEEVEVTDDEAEDETDPSSKRPRLSRRELDAPPGPVEFNEDDMEWQLAQMDEYADEYGDNNSEDEEAGLPLTDDDTVALFRSLLDDFNISPYTTFEKIIEDNALLEDNRYTALPNMHRRREVFLDWSRARVAELQDIKKAEETKKKEDPRVKYLRFLQRNATPKLFWPEFKRKYKKESEMKDYNVSDKDREKLYREYVQKMRASEHDRRKDLLGLLKTLSQGELTRRSEMEDVPDSVLKDLKFYLLDESKRDELVEGYIATLGDG